MAEEQNPPSSETSTQQEETLAQMKITLLSLIQSQEFIMRKLAELERKNEPGTSTPVPSSQNNNLSASGNQNPTMLGTQESLVNPSVTVPVGTNNEASHSFITKEQLQDVLRIEAVSAIFNNPLGFRPR